MFDWRKEFVNHTLEDAVKRCVKVYGIEGAELKAKEILVKMPEFKKKFLDTLYRLYRFGKKD